jgi:ribosomal protein S18 acetylase RimI-like enzyme
VLGAFDASGLVGMVGCRREDGVKCRHVAVIWGMYVAAEARGRGLGRRLLEDAVARARQWTGMDHLWLSVVTTQAAARRLYAACGFRVIGLHPRTIRVGGRSYDEELMVLDL